MIYWIFFHSAQFIPQTVGLRIYIVYKIIFKFLKMCIYGVNHFIDFFITLLLILYLKSFCFLYFWNVLNRDGFYEILRLWERQHMTPGWSVSEALGDRIRALVSAKTELSNHLHFARLFQSQLIAVRIGPHSRKHCLLSS